ncbi:MAG TPA: Gfo/Idh/MocA family oxidoreductase [Gemmatimonadaceae bacterium]|nr:Gfo/Idh/MocA family oxidoreductase [Gemmatimonadaceae bacterium]
MKRREFLHRAGAVATAVPLTRLAACQSDTIKPLGVALVGLGSLSTNQLAPALQKTRNCRLAGIVTGTPAKAAEWKQKYDLPDRSIYDYTSMARMADNPDIDIVYVVTPNALHAEHTIAAARAGKHVLCEKPMEISVERCEAMIAACRDAKRQLAIGYRCRFEPHHLECARLARERAFGDVRIVDAAFGFPIGDPTQWRMNRALSGGGPLMDVGIYALQSTRMITGEEPTMVSAVETKTDPARFRDVEESLTFQLTFPSGTIANCMTTYRVAGLHWLRVFADRGSFGLEPAYNYSGNRGWRSDGAPLKFSEVDHFVTELDEFATRIMTSTPTTVPGEEGLRDVRLMTAIYESARTGRAVKLA